jgi:hypothetical protein
MLFPATAPPHVRAVSWDGHINYNKQAHTKWQPTAVRYSTDYTEQLKIAVYEQTIVKYKYK